MTNMERFLLISKALSDQTRARILMALFKGDLCVCQITELTGLAPSTVSKHLSVLKRAGLVRSWKDTRWVYYALPGVDAPEEVLEALTWTVDSLKDTPVIEDDLSRLEQILKINPTELCKTQAKK